MEKLGIFQSPKCVPRQITGGGMQKRGPQIKAEFPRLSISRSHTLQTLPGVANEDELVCFYYFVK